MPVGTILSYAGDLSKIPNGWALCDGNNGTPDLRDRFLTGAGSSYALGATGGESFHTLTIPEMPSHAHPFSSNSNLGMAEKNSSYSGSGANVLSTNVCQTGYQVSTVFKSLSSLSSGYTGGNQAHENRPPFYAVYWIMKVA